MTEQTKKRSMTTDDETSKTSANPKKKKQIRRSDEGKRSKKLSDRQRGKTRVTIGVALPRWRALKEEKGLRGDTDMALLLLDCYERYARGPSVSTPGKRGDQRAPAPAPSMSSTGAEYERDDALSDISCVEASEEVDVLQERSCTSPVLLRCSMMQEEVCLRQDTETTLPELTEQHRIRQEEEELSGLESVHMAESETECAAPGLNTPEPECVTAHCGVSDVHHTHTPLIKTETDLGSTHTGNFIKTEILENTELGSVTHLHPDRIKTETNDGGYLKAEHISDLKDFKCVHIKFEKIESSEILVSDL
ncbi:uncharacterized protein LOC118220003 isoform X1 [Anguilla anguilla]|uniref:uncharacterized protein LOC118220003 isoform X1 n=1 Tax=Anguilla anguilla TaxID=7936 RepID=UPI0015AA8EAA|nr:uncharacterized protein LOC118220003 isoform X1 [Anguilla anguilla]